MDKEKLNKENGWHILEGFYVSPKTVKNPNIEDYRNNKMTLEEVIVFEENNK
jgi:hypothetical protein